MTLALRRFSLDGIGPPGARFDPLAVDLRAGDDAARTAVLFLENGGGKSVLLRLLFSVVLPGRRFTVGSVKLDGYVGSGDTGHVALEWETADRPLVTGVVLEWRNRTRSSSSSNLRPLWYSFVPRASALTFDDLPTRDGDRRVTRSGFRDRLTALARAHPELELVIEEQPTRWADHLLRATSLDPETFRYQRQMNADEADAESLFSGLRSDDDFVRFVVEAVHDPDQLDGFETLVADYGAQLGRRHELDVEGRFCTQAALALRPLAEAHQLRQDSQRAVDDARQRTETLRTRLLAGTTAAADAASSLRDQAVTQSTRAESRTAEAGRASAVTSELRRLEAQFLLNDASEAVHTAAGALAEANRHAEAAAHVGVAIETRRLGQELHDLRAAQEQADKDLQPLREAAERAASLLGGRLLADAATLDRRAERDHAAATEADRHAAQAAEDAAVTERDAGAETEKARGRRERAREVDDAVATARSDGVLAAGEPVNEATRRAERAHRHAAAELDRTRTAIRRIGLQLRELHSTLMTERGRAQRLGDQLAAVRDELNGHRATADDLLAQPRVQELVPGSEDLWLVIDVLIAALDTAVQGAEAEDRRLRTDIGELDARLDQLGANGLLPASADTQLVLDTVVAAGIPAATGWSWLAHNRDEAGRARALDTNPALAGGVVIVDPTRADEAVQAVTAAGVETETVVLLGAAEQLDEAGAGRAAPVRPAMYDPAWTERTREALRARRDALVERQERTAAALVVDVPLLDRLRQFRLRCPADHRDALGTQTIELETALRSGEDHLEALEDRERQLTGTLETLDGREPALVDEAATAAVTHNRLVALAEQVQRAEGWLAEAGTADARAAEQRDRADHLTHEATRLRSTAESLRTSGREAQAHARQHRDDAARSTDRPVMPDDDAPVAALRGAADAARQAYDAEREGRDLTPRITMVEIQLGERRATLASLTDDVRAKTTSLAEEPGSHDEAVRRDRLEGARRVAAQRDAEHGDARALQAKAEQVLQDRTPPDRPRHAALDHDTEPTSADEAAGAAAEYQERFLQLTRQARAAAEAAEALTEQARRAETDAELLQAAVAVLPPAPAADPGPGEPPPPWDRGADEAREAARSVREELDRADRQLTEAERSEDRALAAVRSVAHDPAHAAVSGVRVALATEDGTSLARRGDPLADELEAMARSIASEQADIARHRDGIIQRLATFVEAHLRQLRQLTRLSTLPQGLGGWSGRPFVSVDFEPASGAEITARLGPVVDEAAGDPRRRRALDLVLAGLRAAVVQTRGGEERTFTVRLLRPNRTMTFDRATISELDQEFSGGMKLTAAICTYCALAALRAASRSSGSLLGHEPGPLFLDNPLGKASADYLLDLQHAIAEKLQVQLVHTTGVWDVEALASYERVVRLRNLADLRRNVRRLRVDDNVHLPGAGATIDAAGITVRRDVT